MRNTAPCREELGAAPEAGVAIEIDICARCHGRLRVIASIEDLAVIARILVHRDRTFATWAIEAQPLQNSVL